MRKSSISYLFDIRRMLSVLDIRTLDFVCFFSDVLFDVSILGYLYLGISLDKIKGRRTMYRYPHYLWAGTGTPIPG